MTAIYLVIFGATMVAIPQLIAIRDRRPALTGIEVIASVIGILAMISSIFAALA